VASNAAYGAARLHQDAAGEVVDWVRGLEYDRLRLPAPDWQVLLDVPTGLAADRARQREGRDATRSRDTYERDDGLQRRTGEVYAGLAARNFGGRWRMAPPDVDPADLAASLGR
jgi:dTMP kinase